MSKDLKDLLDKEDNLDQPDHEVVPVNKDLRDHKENQVDLDLQVREEKMDNEENQENKVHQEPEEKTDHKAHLDSQVEKHLRLLKALVKFANKMGLKLANQQISQP